jgi:hypothetical protein
MASLEGKNINDTYDGLLKTITNNVLNGDVITDGKGNPSALKLGNSLNSSTFDSDLNTSSNFVAGNNITADNNLSANGNLTVSGTISGEGDIIAFTSSDSRLKDNLIPIDSQNYVNNLTGYEFDWNERSKRSGKGKGIIAQHLYQIDKSLVHETNEGYLTVDYIGLIPVLIEEVKRLGKEIEELKK